MIASASPQGQDALAMGLRTILKARALHETEGAREIPGRATRNAARRDKRSGRRSRWRAVPVERAPPI